MKLNDGILAITRKKTGENSPYENTYEKCLNYLLHENEDLRNIDITFSQWLNTDRADLIYTNITC